MDRQLNATKLVKMCLKLSHLIDRNTQNLHELQTVKMIFSDNYPDVALLSAVVTLCSLICCRW